MATESPAPVLLCCLLWALPGQRPAMRAYEDRVTALLGDHGARLEERVLAVEPAEDRPAEVQVYRFPDRAALTGYLDDPRRLALAPERDRCVARTELFEVTRG